MSGETTIDVWDVETFDEQLRAELTDAKSLIHDYMETDRRNFLEREASDRWFPHRENPFAPAFHRLVEFEIMPMMQMRTIRAWHYTRLVDAEVDELGISGISLSDSQNLRRRLDALMAAGIIDTATTNRLYDASALHDDPFRSRSGKFWLTSRPRAPDYGGVAPLLESWGGEVVHFRLTDPELKRRVAAIGRPRVLEVAVPIEATMESYSAAEAVVAAFGKLQGCEPDRGDFDLYTIRHSNPRPS